MSFEALLDRTAVVIHRTQTGTEDRYNSPTWETSEEVAPCYLEQVQESEITVGRETQLASHLLILGPDVGLDGSDQVEIEGTVYELVGPPRFVDNPRLGFLHHIEADVREIDAREEST